MKAQIIEQLLDGNKKIVTVSVTNKRSKEYCSSNVTIEETFITDTDDTDTAIDRAEDLGKQTREFTGDELLATLEGNAKARTKGLW